MNRMLASLVVALLMVAPVLASEEKSKETEKGTSEKKKEESLSFSNADLERRYGGGTSKKSTESASQSSTADKQSADAGPSALDKMFAAQATSKEKAGNVSEAEGAVAAARERVAQLEKKNLAVVNPFLARPAPPEDEAEAERWKAMNGAERANAAKTELEAARKALAEAEAALAAARGN